MEIINHREVIVDTGLAERIITAPGYELYCDKISLDSEMHIKQSPGDNMIIVLWNWWVSN